MTTDLLTIVRQQLAANRAKQTEVHSDGISEVKFHATAKEMNQRDAQIIFCGSKNSGKSTIISRFLDRIDMPKPTVALDYTYGRRTRGTNKDTGNIWEIGGGDTLINLIEVILKPRNIRNTSLVFVIDLTKPCKIWKLYENVLLFVKAYIRKIMGKDEIEFVEVKKKYEAHKDRNIMNPFLIPLAIIASKYDEFQMFSEKLENTVLKIRGVISHLLFDTKQNKSLVTDLDKPLCIPAFMDDIDIIGNPPGSSELSVTMKSRDLYELWSKSFKNHVAQSEEKVKKNLDDFINDPQYADDDIDTIIQRKANDLQEYIKHKKSREKLESRAELELT